MSSSRAPTDLALALDTANPAQAEAWIEATRGLSLVYKVGLELFTAAGPQWTAGLTRAGHRVFLDLKLHDIPNTVAKTVEQIARLGVEWTTVHLSGGPRMLAEAQKARGGVKLLGVSVLTSFSAEEWSVTVSQVASNPHSPAESVLGLAALAAEAKLFGLVCSPQELAQVRARFPALTTVVPGVRPAGSDRQDQARTMTPAEAVAAGAGALVVGRPITQSADPAQAARAILKEIGR